MSSSESEEPTASSETRAGMPRWVKVSLIVAAVLIAVFVIVNVAGGGGGHGPQRHSSGPPIGTEAGG